MSLVDKSIYDCALSNNDYAIHPASLLDFVLNYAIQSLLVTFQPTPEVACPLLPREIIPAPLGCLSGITRGHAPKTRKDGLLLLSQKARQMRRSQTRLPTMQIRQRPLRRLPRQKIAECEYPGKGASEENVRLLLGPS